MYDNGNIQHTSHEAYMYFRSFFERSGAISLLLPYLPAKTVDSVPCTVHLNNFAALLPCTLHRQYFHQTFYHRTVHCCCCFSTTCVTSTSTSESELCKLLLSELAPTSIASMSILDIGADRVAKGSGSAARRVLTCRRVVAVECWVLVDVYVGGLVYSHIYFTVLF